MQDAIEFLDYAGRRPGASKAALESLAATLWGEAPADYLGLLRESNGYEGFVGKAYLVVWPAEDVVQSNIEYGFRDRLPKFTLIATNGAGEGYGFMDGRYTNVPLIDGEASQQARTWKSLIEMFQDLSMHGW